MYKKILLLINPVSGQENHILRPLHTYFSKHTIHADIRVTVKKEDIKRIIQETDQKNYDAVVVYGGDGTLNEAIQALASTDIPLVILPGGTANILAHELKIPETAAEAIKVLLSKTTKKRKIDIGIANDIPFMLRVSTGPLADMVLNTNTFLKNTLGKAAYGVTFISELQKSKKVTYTLWIDGKEIVEEGISLVVVNSGNLGFLELNFHPMIRIDDGFLDVFIIKEPDLMTLTGTVKDALIDKKITNLVHYKGKKIKVTISSPQAITCDDTKLRTNELDITVVPKYISVLVP